MTVAAHRVVVHIQQMKGPYDAPGCQVVVLPDIGADEFRVLVLRAEAVHRHRYRFHNADGIGQLYFTPVCIPGTDDILCNLPRHICTGAVYLGGVFPGERTAADPSDAAVGITGQLPAGHAAVGKRAAYHKTAGRVDQLFKITFDPVLAGRQHHHGFYDVPEIAHLHIRAVLHGTQEGGDPAAVVIVADLCLGICPEHPGRVVFQKLKKFCGHGKRDREQFRRLVSGIAEHNALIAGAAFVHTEGNVQRLLRYQDADVQTMFQPIAKFLSADPVKNFLRQSAVIRPMFAGQLTGNDQMVIFQQTLNRYTAVLIMLQFPE